MRSRGRAGSGLRTSVPRSNCLANSGPRSNGRRLEGQSPLAVRSRRGPWRYVDSRAWNPVTITPRIPRPFRQPEGIPIVFMMEVVR